MLITYEPIFRATDDGVQTTSLMVSKAGNILVSMSAFEFEVKHRAGSTHVDLFRHITVEQARKLADALMKAADENETIQKTVFVNGQTIPVSAFAIGAVK